MGVEDPDKVEHDIANSGIYLVQQYVKGGSLKNVVMQQMVDWNVSGRHLVMRMRVILLQVDCEVIESSAENSEYRTCDLLEGI
jgi:hypothetical protein